MAAPILWPPGIFSFFLQENLHAHKILRFGGGILGWGGGGSANVICMGTGFFLTKGGQQKRVRSLFLYLVTFGHFSDASVTFFRRLFARLWALFCPTFPSVKMFCVFVLCDLVKTD